MKSFKNILSEVAQPKSSEEKAFKDQHNQKVAPHPVAPDSQFSGDIGKSKASRPMDQEDDANYDQAYGDKPDQEPVLRKGRKFSQFRANESKEMATQAALDKATAASKEGKKKVTLAKAPWDKKEEVSEKLSDLAFAKWNEALSEAADTHTVDIDHMGGPDAAAKKHNITLKKSKGTADSHSATGKKKDLQKYLAHHYDSAEDAKDNHPEVHEALSGKQKKLDHNKNGKIDGHDFAIMRSRKKSNEEVDVVETTSSAMKTMVNQTGPDGKTRTVNKKTRVDRTDDKGQDVMGEKAINELDRKTLGSYIKKAHSDKDKQVAKDKHYQAKGDTMDRDDDMYHQWGKANAARKKAQNRTAGISKAADKLVRKESFTETLDEAVKVGNLRLKNGKNVKVSKQDAKLLNDFYKNLNAKNRRDMEKVMMKDDAGFKEIVGFAREAL